MHSLLGKKIGMTRVFDENGQAIPATVIQAGPCHVMQVKDLNRDGYWAVQLGFDDARRKRAGKPMGGHARKAGVEPKRFIREVRLDAKSEAALGDEVTVAVLEGVTAVDVIGTSKGRGFAGVMKRHGFAGLKASHGVHRVHRSPGSIGASATPSRVIKGTRMAGHYGHARVTVKNLKVVSIDAADHVLVVRGAIPGPNGSYVIIRRHKGAAKAAGK